MKHRKNFQTQDHKQMMNHFNSKDIRNHMTAEIECFMSERYKDSMLNHIIILNSH